MHRFFSYIKQVSRILGKILRPFNICWHFPNYIMIFLSLWHFVNIVYSSLDTMGAAPKVMPPTVAQSILLAQSIRGWYWCYGSRG